MKGRINQTMDELTEQQLRQRLLGIRRELGRSNTCVLVALIITVGLAIVAVVYALQAERNAQAAHRANQATQAELWRSKLAQARALRWSEKVGRRQEALQAIAQAVAIRPSSELRNEAVATLALVDIQPGEISLPASGRVHAYALSPHFTYCAFGHVDGGVEVHTVTNKQTAIRFQQANQRVFSLAFSSDERYVAARYEGGGLEVWDLRSLRQVLILHFPQREASLHPVSFHPNNRHLAVACEDNTVRILNLESSRCESEYKLNSRPWSALFDPKGERLAVGTGRKVVLLAFPSGAMLGAVEAPDTVGRIQWHPDGNLIAAGSPLGRVMLLDMRSGKVTELDAHTQRVINVLFHPSGRLLVSASWDGTTRFWNPCSGRSLLEIQAGYALAFDADGGRLGFFREQAGVWDWRLDLDQSFSTVSPPLDGDKELLAVGLSSDGRLLAATKRGSVCLWERSTGRELDCLKWGRSWGVAFTSDDRALLLSSDTGIFRVPLVDYPSMASLRLGKPELVPGVPAGVYAHGDVSCGDRPRFCAEGSPYHVLLDLSPPHRAYTLPGGWDNSAPASPDGRLAATSRWKGGGTRLWSLATRQVIRTLPDEGGVSRFSPDGRRLVVGTSSEFLFYDVPSGNLERRLPRDCSSAISGLLAFSPDGQYLAVTHTLRQLRLLAPDSGDVLATLDAPLPERITALCFSGNSAVLAAATDNADIQLWDLRLLRHRLREMNLDWQSTKPLPPPEPGTVTTASRAASSSATKSNLGHHRHAMWLSGAGAGLAFLFGLFSVRHHRHLVLCYEAVEALAEQRRKDLQVAQTQLVHSQKMKALGTLAAGVAHDFNNLLSIIRMSNQLLARQVEPTAENREELDAIEQAVTQGKGIVRSVLGYTRQAGAGLELYSVAEVVSDTLAMLNQGFLSGIVLTLELDAAAPQVRGLRTRLEQILLNLVVNAAEAMDGRGKLTLSVREVSTPGRCLLPPRSTGPCIELAVADSGPGITPETLPRVFEPFFSTKPSGAERGVGLGLTTVYTIAEQDGLGLDLATEPGKGTTFRILLPVAGANASIEAPPSASASPPPP